MLIEKVGTSEYRRWFRFREVLTSVTLIFGHVG